MKVMKPQLVINHRGKVLQALTLLQAGINIRTFLTRMQDQRDETDTLRKDRVKYDKQRFLTLVFENSWQQPVSTSNLKSSLSAING